MLFLRNRTQMKQKAVKSHFYHELISRKSAIFLYEQLKNLLWPSKSVAECKKSDHCPWCALHAFFGQPILLLGTNCISWAKKKVTDCTTAACLETSLKFQSAVTKTVKFNSSCMPLASCSAFSHSFQKKSAWALVEILSCSHTALFLINE